MTKTLLERLAAADEGGYELDAEIDELLYPGGDKWLCLCYTTSLDAAMTLVPKGWFLESLEELVTRYEYKGIWGEKTGSWQAEIQEVKEQGSLKMASAPTAPLALVIAILKARGIE